MNDKYINLDFTSIHAHIEGSNFRMLDSIIKVKQLIQRAIELNYSGIAITDHECLSMHVPALQYIEELRKDRKISDKFKLLLGNEIYLVNSMEEVKDNYISGMTKYWHFILIAKDQKGYRQLKEISSNSAWKNYFVQNGMERVPTLKGELESIIGDNKGHLIASSACLGGEIPSLCIDYFKNNNQEAKKKLHQMIMWCINVFGKENFFLELQPSALSGSEQSQTQAFVNKCLIKLAKAYDLKYIVTTDAHYLNREDRIIHEAYLKSDGKSSDRELGDFYETTYLMPINEIVQCLENHLTKEEAITAIQNTGIIYSMISKISLKHSVIVPEDTKIPSFNVLHIFKEWYEKYEYIAKYAYSTNIQERYFLYLCETGFLEKKQKFSEENISRINLEIKELWNISDSIGMRLASYYTLVRGLIHNIMWKVSFVGVARGSVTGFYTAYLMGITQMNPLKYNLAHWRHISAERPELPDIDIDTSASKRSTIFEMMKEYYGYDNVLNTITFKTEGSKSAMLTSCRGLGINDDIAHAIADLIPFERGSNWSLSDCFYGNEEKGRAPVKEFINEVSKYDRLKETAFMIEGLICGRSIHASAAYVFKDGYLEQNSRMKAPNGKDITAYNMNGSDYCGGLKIDVLTIKALDKMQKCVELLSKYGYLQDQGSLKATYDKYIHPDVLDYDTPEMWNLIGENKLIDAFQFDTQQGLQAAKAIQPKSIVELATANSLMRLMAADGEEQPVDTYVRNKADINNWYHEMRDNGLTEDEIHILEPYLLPVYGVAETQEVVMRLSMDKHIAGFSVAESNKLRKSIAKKKADVLEETRQMFFEKGEQLRTSQKLLDYVWYVQFKKSFGYSFSQNHTFPYSCICLQEMNLAYHYPNVFWNTACLTVNAEADEESEKTTDYGKIATAISLFNHQGQKVILPDINQSEFEFTPDVKNNQILYCLKAINGVSDDLIKIIISNRPYKSFNDFYEKITAAAANKECKCGPTSIISLIKAGCFDNIESSRVNTMKKYMVYLTKPVSQLTLTHLDNLKTMGYLISTEDALAYRVYKFKKYVTTSKFFAFAEGKSKSTFFYKLEPKYALPFFYEYIEQYLKENKDYYLYEDTIAVKESSLNKVCKLYLQDIKDNLFNNPTVVQNYNQFVVNKVTDNYIGDITEDEFLLSKWEKEAVNYYYHKHELSDIDTEKYLISDFYQLPSTPTIIDYYNYGKFSTPRFALTRIAGMVLNKNKDKHIVTLLTPTGVVNVKFYKGQFIFYNKRLSEEAEDGTKNVIEESWFSRGNLLLITGMRRGEQFVAKKYKDSIYKHTVQLITGFNSDHTEMILQSDRKGEDE